MIRDPKQQWKIARKEDTFKKGVRGNFHPLGLGQSAGRKLRGKRYKALGVRMLFRRKNRLSPFRAGAIWMRYFVTVQNLYNMGRFRELKVWQKAVDLAVDVYKITRIGDIARDFGLIDQMRRCGVSIASNIAEGDELKSDAQAVKHFYYSKGSSAELITQLIISERVGYIDKEKTEELIERCTEVSRMLNGLVKHRSNK